MSEPFRNGVSPRGIHLGGQRPWDVLTPPHSIQEQFQDRMSCLEHFRNGECLRHCVPFYVDVGICGGECAHHALPHNLGDLGLVPLEILPGLALRNMRR